MVNFFGLGRADPVKSEKSKPKREAPQMVPVASEAHNDKQREMIRMALSGVLRRHGIGSHWISCDMLPIRQPSGPDIVLIQLVVRKWHDGLVLYAPELQNEFVQEIRLFNKTADAANFPIVWKFATDCGYPNGPLPMAEFWGLKASSGVVISGSGVVTAAAAAVVPAPEPKFDLPLSRFDNPDQDDEDHGFAPTQMRQDL